MGLAGRGLYYADGSKFKDKWKHTVVFCLSKTEAAVHSKLFVIIRKLGLEPSVLTRDGYGGMNVRIYNKDLFNALPKKSEAYYPRIPLAYVAGLFDGDGYFKEGRGESWVFVQASYPHLAHQVYKILSKFGPITLTSTPRPNGWLPINHVRVLKKARDSLRKTDFARYCARLSSL